ncbi:Uncharacterised protein [Segatella copri]|nr:Uncharacterised protein [Segatella copri]
MLEVRSMSMEMAIKSFLTIGESRQKSISLLLPTRRAAINTIFSPEVTFRMIFSASTSLSQKYSGLILPVIIKGFSILFT